MTKPAETAAGADFFKDLQAEERRFATVPVTKWGRTVRLMKLTGPEQVELNDFAAQFPKAADGSFVKVADSMKFAAELIARSVVLADSETKPFDNAGGRKYLEREEIDTVNELMGAAMDLNELGDLPGKIAKAKKK